MRSSDRDEAVSWVVAALAAAALAAVGALELKGRIYANELIARNAAERTMSLLLSATRALRGRSAERLRQNPPQEGPGPQEEVGDFAAVLGEQKTLGERVRGLAAYGSDGKALFSWGDVPAAIEPLDRPAAAEGMPPRVYRFVEADHTLRVIHPFPVFRHPAAREEARDESRGAVRGEGDGALLYYVFNEDDYFRGNAIARALFVLWVLLSCAAAFIVRHTLRRNAQYRETLRAQSELVALGTAARTLAHEIKNPLSAISLQADLIARIAPGISDREVAVIRGETARIQVLVDRIGDFLREPAGSPEDLVLPDFLGEALSRAGPEGTPARIDREGAENAVVRADRLRLRSVAENLVRNAYDSGGDSAEVFVRVRAESAGVSFEVLDRGAGFPEGLSPETCFDPFFTTKTRGFGLGLALSRRFVEAAGGTLTLRPREGGGAVARALFPRRPA